MNLPETKYYLRQAKRLNSIVEAKTEQIESLRCKADRLGYSITEKVQSGKKNTHMDIVDRIIDLEAEINNDIIKLITAEDDIRKKINSVENNEYKLLLTLRYLNYKTWEEIADIMGYSVRHIHRLHGAALRKCDNVIECHY